MPAKIDRKKNPSFIRRISFQELKEWFSPKIRLENPHLYKELLDRSTLSLFLFIITICLVSFFIVLISLASNIGILHLIKSLLPLGVLFAIVFLIHKLTHKKIIDYWMLLVCVFLIATWGVGKDVINFSIVFNRYGILYITLLFFGLIFMPFPPWTAIVLGIYCSLLYGVLWLLFVYRIFGIEWITSLGDTLGVSWVRLHFELMTAEDFYFPHWRYLSVWYFAQYLLFGLAVGILRAANFHTFRQVSETSFRLQAKESDLNAMRFLLSRDEDQHVEFKSSMRWDMQAKHLNRDLEHVIVKTLAGFLNAEGGTLVIGVNDQGSVVGLKPDYSTLKKKDRDGFELHLIRLISNYFGKEYCRQVHISFYPVSGEEICSVNIRPSLEPVFVQQMEGSFFLRTGNSTQRLNTREALEYIRKHFS